MVAAVVKVVVVVAATTEVVGVAGCIGKAIGGSPAAVARNTLQTPKMTPSGKSLTCSSSSSQTQPQQVRSSNRIQQHGIGHTSYAEESY